MLNHDFKLKTAANIQDEGRKHISKESFGIQDRGLKNCSSSTQVSVGRLCTKGSLKARSEERVDGGQRNTDNTRRKLKENETRSKLKH